MKKILFLILSLSLFAKETYNLSVKVDNLRDNKGVVLFSLYNKDGSIPDEKLEKYFKQKKQSISNNSASVIFSNLPKGNYAIFMVHDENKNNKIDKGFILPIEGVGLSNFKTINLFNKPNFKRASFLLNTDKSISIIPVYF